MGGESGKVTYHGEKKVTMNPKLYSPKKQNRQSAEIPEPFREIKAGGIGRRKKRVGIQNRNV